MRVDHCYYLATVPRMIKENFPSLGANIIIFPAVIEEYNVSVPRYIPLPIVITELNCSMCRPTNRKGVVCSECMDGYGPSLTSYGYKCIKCADAWYRIPLLLIYELLPITVNIVLVFQISVTTPPIPSFIMYAQFIIIIVIFLGYFYLDIFDLQLKSVMAATSDNNSIMVCINRRQTFFSSVIRFGAQNTRIPDLSFLDFLPHDSSPQNLCRIYSALSSLRHYLCTFM